MRFILVVTFLITYSIAFSKDKGIGILSISTDSPGRITLPVYEKSGGGKLLGSFIYESGANGQSNYSIRIEGLELDNLLEFGYEKSGLPIDQIQGEWIRVICGTNKAGKTVCGWIKDQKHAEHFFWRDYLMEVPLFFESREDIHFYENPNGLEMKFQLQKSASGRYDYIMKPLSSNGNWLKVEVTTPSNYCETPQSMESEVFWIKFLTKDGRPLVWYFTRGC